MNTVWYFGEDTKKYDSTFYYSTEGSWTAGVGEVSSKVDVPGLFEEGKLMKITR